jgi:Uma2 family endonuclease
MTTTIAPNKINHLKQLFYLSQDRHSGAEEIFVLNDVTWEEFSELLDILPENRGTLLRYLKGELEIMAPGRNHEQIKKLLGILLECYFFEKDIEVIPLGSTTFRHPLSQKGIEPDESYCFDSSREYPDLAIEIIFTSGGLDLLEIYRVMEVQEVWFWEKEELKFFRLKNDCYQEVDQSNFLLNIEKSFLEKLLLSTDSLNQVRKIFQQKIQTS